MFEGIEIVPVTVIIPICYLTDHDHGTVSGILVAEQPLVGSPVRIKDDVWIGAHVTVMKGVQIESGAVVGAGAVGTRSVAANSIVARVPARPVGIRV